MSLTKTYLYWVFICSFLGGFGDEERLSEKVDYPIISLEDVLYEI